MSEVKEIKFYNEELFKRAEGIFLTICGFDLSRKRDRELYEEALEVRNCSIKEHTVSGRVAAFNDDIFIYALKSEELIFEKDSVAKEYYAHAWETAYLDAGRYLLEKMLKDKALENGTVLSKSYAPGFDGIDIMKSKELAEILNLEELGISVNESGMMSPVKSVTGLYFSSELKEAPPLEKCKQCLGNKASCKFCKFYIKKNSNDAHRKISSFTLPENFVLNSLNNLNSFEKQAYGIAFDIGTTTVAGLLWDLSTGKYLGAKAIFNSQRIYGADVISRIHFASESEDNLIAAQGRIVADINEIICFFIEKFHFCKEDIVKITAVGNTAMSHLLMKGDPKLIATAPFSPLFLRGASEKAWNLGIDVALKTDFYLMPNLAGHIGSDVTAGILAAEIAKSERTILQIDIGTNGEIVLLRKGEILICSAAAGPAFEAASLSHGMSAGRGAIEGVSIENDEVRLRIIENSEAKGICGSGIIEAVSELLKVGVVDKTGRILSCVELLEKGLSEKIATLVREGSKGREFVLDFNEPTRNAVTVTQKDIREIQTAKGAIYAGILILLETMGISEKDLEQINIAGAFGNYINAESAMRIGLLPKVDIGKISFIGNAAGIGASMELLSEDIRNQALEIAKCVKHVELSEYPRFQEIFLKSLDF